MKGILGVDRAFDVTLIRCISDGVNHSKKIAQVQPGLHDLPFLPFDHGWIRRTEIAGQRHQMDGIRGDAAPRSRGLASLLSAGGLSTVGATRQLAELALLAEGERVGRKRVTRLMRELGHRRRDAPALQDGHDEEGRQGQARAGTW